MARAKIIFFPKLGTADYPVDNIIIVDKYYSWTNSTDSFVTDGYVMTNNVTNISDINNNYWITFKPKVGYKFNSVHKTNSDGESNSGEFLIEGDGSVIIRPWISGTSTIVNNYLYFDVVQDSPDLKVCTVTTNLSNCVSDALSEYQETDDVTINVTSNTNYFFNTTPTVTMDETTLSFTLSEDKKSASINFVITDDVVVNAVAIYEPFTFTTDLTNCYCEISGDTYLEDDLPIKFYPNLGYEFINNGEYVDTYGVSHEMPFSSDKSYAYIDEVFTYATLSAQKIVERIGSFCNLYVADNAQLEQLSNARYITDSEGNTLDVGTFINSLYVLPFTIEATRLVPSTIQLGYKPTNIPTNMIDGYMLEVDLGNITTPLIYNNAYDFINTKCILHLPYLKNVSVNNEYVINKTLNIKYVIDLYSGEGTAVISVDNVIVDSVDLNVALNIPFSSYNSNGVINKLENRVHNFIPSAFIEVVRNKPYTSSTPSIFGKKTVEYEQLKNYNGYLQVENIKLNSSCTNKEKEEIISMLKNGVFINE